MPATMTPDRLRSILALVRADMTDDQIEELAAGDGRLRTSLLGERACKRDPLLAAFRAASDRLRSAHAAWKEACQRGDAGEVAMRDFEMNRARGRLHLALDALDNRREPGPRSEGEILQYPSGEARDLKSY
jgi:hypothetical protein